MRTKLRALARLLPRRVLLQTGLVGLLAGSLMTNAVVIAHNARTPAPVLSPRDLEVLRAHDGFVDAVMTAREAQLRLATVQE